MEIGKLAPVDHGAWLPMFQIHNMDWQRGELSTCLMGFKVAGRGMTQGAPRIKFEMKPRRQGSPLAGKPRVMEDGFQVAWLNWNLEALVNGHPSRGIKQGELVNWRPGVWRPSRRVGNDAKVGRSP